MPSMPSTQVCLVYVAVWIVLLAAHACVQFQIQSATAQQLLVYCCIADDLGSLLCGIKLYWDLSVVFLYLR